MQGEVVSAVAFEARVGEAGQADDIIRQYGKTKKNASGVEMLRSIEKKEM